VYGFSKAETDGWGSGVTLAFLGAGVALIVAFVAIQRRSSGPLLPLRVLADRNRAGSYLAIGIAGAGMFGVFLFLTYFMQQTLGYSPVKTGLAFLPMTFVLSVFAAVAQTRVLPKTGPRPVIIAGMLLASLGLTLLAQVDASSAYALHILPGLMIMGAGMGLTFATAMSNATYGVSPADAGVASAMVNTSQQVGGSIGTALSRPWPPAPPRASSRARRRTRRSPWTPPSRATPPRSSSRPASSPSAPSSAGSSCAAAASSSPRAPSPSWLTERGRHRRFRTTGSARPGRSGRRPAAGRACRPTARSAGSAPGQSPATSRSRPRSATPW